MGKEKKPVTLAEEMAAWPEVPAWTPVVAVSTDHLEYDKLREEAEGKFGKRCAHAYYERLMTTVKVLHQMHLDVACQCGNCCICNGRILYNQLRKELIGG